MLHINKKKNRELCSKIVKRDLRIETHFCFISVLFRRSSQDAGKNACFYSDRL